MCGLAKESILTTLKMVSLDEKRREKYGRLYFPEYYDEEDLAGADGFNLR